MPCLNSTNTISRNPRHKYVDAINSFNNPASITSIKQRYTKYSRTLSLSQAIYQGTTITYNHYIKWNGFIKNKKYPLTLNREEFKSTIVSAFHPIVITSSVLEEEEVNVPREDVELLEKSEYNRFSF